MSSDYSILVLTHAEQRKAFDTFNVLRRNRKFLICSGRGLLVRALLSFAYRQKVYFVSDDDYLFFDDLRALLIAKGESFTFLPVEEATTRLFILQRAKLRQDSVVVNAALPTIENFDVAADKKRLAMFCIENNLLTPDIVTRDNYQSEKFRHSALIVKPSKGSGSRGIFSVNFVDEVLSSCYLDSADWIIQKKLENGNEVYGGFYLFQHGQLKRFYGHKRLRTFPTSGGVSVLSKSFIDHSLREKGAKLLGYLQWHGLAMVEFLWDSDSGDWSIIEVNPRIWGSIALSERCGSGMLGAYCDVASGKEVGAADAPETDTYLWWPFPRDIVNLLRGQISIRQFLEPMIKKSAVVNVTGSTVTRTLFFFTAQIALGRRKSIF